MHNPLLIASRVWCSTLAIMAMLSGCRSPEKPATASSTGIEEAFDEPELDADGDGFSVSEDCDDTDASVSPNGIEVCDGIDNDCDGVIDPDTAAGVRTWFIDADGDGYGNPAATFEACEPGESGVENALDCDDGDAATSPDGDEVCDGIDNDCDSLIDGEDDSVDPSSGALFYSDFDGDGYGDPEAPEFACERRAGLVDDATDCNDADPDIHPDAIEICDDLDNDCDGLTDDEDDNIDLSTVRAFYPDVDGDGYGVPTGAIQGCSLPTGYSAEATDCDDDNIAINPGATEVCDDLNVDEDCDGAIDDADPSVDPASGILFYVDGDGDGFGDRTDAGTVWCADPADGSVVDNTDCDDAAADINPDATEVCDLSDIDEDCDGTADDADTSVDPSGFSNWYTDSDSDGFGDRDVRPTAQCDAPSGAVLDRTDCDDGDSSINPDAIEICDDLDNDCDDLIDDDDDSLDATTATTWFEDGDSDGYGAAGTALELCAAPTGYVADDTDCDDEDADINPGEIEVCDDLDTDEDCSGTADDLDSGVDASTFTDWSPDTDSDGYGDATATLTAQCDAPTGSVDNAADCDDGEFDINPDATEACDSIDNDCDTLVDDDDPSLDPTTATEWAPDTDGDGFGDDASVVRACTSPSGYTDVLGDCDDGEFDINPDAQEVCDADDTDEDCDGLIDDADDSVDASTGSGSWYVDSDGDGYGDETASAELLCDTPTSGYVVDNTDCDDKDAEVNPGATEVCDLADNDCDPSTTADGTAYWVPDSGTPSDVTSTLGGSSAVSVTWSDDGALYLCAGVWSLNATVDGAILDVVGVGGSSAVTVNGRGGRLLDVENGADLSLNGFTLKNGYTSSTGAAVRVRGSSLVGDDLEITDHSAGDHGGALFVSNSAVELSNTIIDDNYSAGDGGGLYATGSSTVVLDTCTLEDNSASDGGAANINDASTLTMDNSTLTDNYASAYGGALRCQDGTSVSITSSDFSLNSSIDGGAVELFGSCTGTVESSTFSNNYASDDGGAIWAENTLDITGSTFTDNTASGQGGSVWSDDLLTVDTSSFTDGYSGDDGGAIRSKSTLTVSSSVFHSNQAADRGGAIDASEATTVSASTFTDNYADDAAAIDSNASLVINNSTFDSNSVGDKGGVLRLNYGASDSCEINGGSFTNNTARDGGVVYADFGSSSSILEVDSAVFTNNTAWSNGDTVRYKYGSSSNYTFTGTQSFTCQSSAGCY